MKILRAIVCLELLLLVAAPAAAENYAIIVGVNECPNFRLPGGDKPRPLRGAEADADAVATVLLQDYGFAKDQVRLLKGPAATYAKVKAAFQEVIDKARPDDVFVF